MAGRFCMPLARDLAAPTPAETDEILDEARRLLRWGHRTIEQFVEGGEVPGSIISGSGSRGVCGSAHHNRQFVAVYRPAPGEAEQCAAYHDWCDEHGYDVEARSRPECPPDPVYGGGVHVGLTWRRIRQLLAERGEATQLEFSMEAA